MRFALLLLIVACTDATDLHEPVACGPAWQPVYTSCELACELRPANQWDEGLDHPCTEAVNPAFNWTSGCERTFEAERGVFGCCKPHSPAGGEVDFWRCTKWH